MGGISGGAGGVSGDPLGFWEGFLVSSSAQTGRSHQGGRQGLTSLKSLPCVAGKPSGPLLDLNQFRYA